MMRRIMLFTAAALFAAQASAQTGSQACPIEAPRLGGLRLDATPMCDRSAPGCQTSMSFSFAIVSLTPPCLPSLPCLMPYRLQACDVVTWNFGDGSEPVSFRDHAQHTFTTPANVALTVTISNALGSIQMSREVVVADEPVRIGFEKVVTREDAGVVSIPLTRSGDLARTASLRVYRAELSFEQSVTFGPGETSKSVSVPIVNDEMFWGARYERVEVDNVTGGTIVTNAPIEIHDDEPRPVLSVADVRVREGDAGSTYATMTFQLSGPMAWRYQQHVLMDILDPYSAAYDKDFAGTYDGIWFEKGRTSATLMVPIKGDRTPEANEEMVLRVEQMAGERPRVERTTASILVLNDDASLDPPSQRVPIGTRDSLKLDIGNPLVAPVTAQIFAPEGLRLPSTIDLAAGESNGSIPFIADQVGTWPIRAQVDTPDVQLVAEAVIEVVPPPVIETIEPATGSPVGGTRVRIAGSGFEQGSVVTVGGALAHVLDVTADAIVVVTPPHAAGSVDVVVTSAFGLARRERGFTYGMKRRRAVSP